MSTSISSQHLNSSLLCGHKIRPKIINLCDFSAPCWRLSEVLSNIWLLSVKIVFGVGHLNFFELFFVDKMAKEKIQKGQGKKNGEKKANEV